MTETIPEELVSLIEGLREQVASLSARVAQLERPAAVAPVVAAGPATAAAPPPPVAKSDGITEEEVLAISAALAAYLGVRVHIRQIRLISSGAWASEGRASIQASHRLHS
jgi:methylmalonyl-CoA carboxyltransferase 12S subunit